MSPATDLIDALTARGVTLGTEDGRLWFEPRDALTPDLLAELRTHKAELLSLLTTTVRCPWCGSTDLIEGRRGVWCQQCARLAWLPTQGGGAVRADLASDADRAESARRWQQWMAIIQLDH